MNLNKKIEHALGLVDGLKHENGEINYNRAADKITKAGAKVSRQAVKLWIEGNTQEIAHKYIVVISKISGKPLNYFSEDGEGEYVVRETSAEYTIKTTLVEWTEIPELLEKNNLPEQFALDINIPSPELANVSRLLVNTEIPAEQTIYVVALLEGRANLFEYFHSGPAEYLTPTYPADRSKVYQESDLEIVGYVEDAEYRRLPQK